MGNNLQGLSLYHVVMGNISNTILFDELPLDITLHGFFGIFVIWCFSKYKHGIVWSFVIALVFALFKEWLDSHTMRYTTDESIRDVLSTIFFPFLFLLSEIIRKIKE